MFDFKVLIVRDDFLLKEFEVHYTDETTVKMIIDSYLKDNFNENCNAHYFFI